MKRSGIGLGFGAAFLAAAVSLLAVLVLQAGPASARGYEGAQAEAQLDGQLDPYSFPNIKLCCQPKPVHKPHRPGWWRPDGKPPGSPVNVVVNCGLPTSRSSFGSVGEALSYMRGAPGQISVVPGTACDISGLTFGSGVTLTTANYTYGGRALVGGSRCARVVAAGPFGPTVFGGIDMDICLEVRAGEASLQEVNLSWRGRDAAILVTNSSLVMKNSTVRARDAALHAVSAGRVWVRDSRLATTQGGPFVFRASAANIDISDVLLKGARAGVVIDGVRDALQIVGANVVRSEPEDPYPASSPGDYGILISGGQAMNDLPWLSGMEAQRVVVKGTNVSGYGVGVSIGAGSSVIVEDTTVRHPTYGIKVLSGAFVTLRNNKIKGSSSVAIDLDGGARGEADGNKLVCRDGSCVCYAGECTSRSDRVFANGLFRMRDTDCDR